MNNNAKALSNLLFFLPTEACISLSETLILESSIRVNRGGEEFSLSPATGDSWDPVYKEIAATSEDKTVVLRSNTNFFQLDNLLGTDLADKYDFETQLLRNLLYPLGVFPNKLHFPSKIDDFSLIRKLTEFDDFLLQNTVHVQGLGLGPDGHFALWFPFDSKDLSSEDFLRKKTSMVCLAESYRVGMAKKYSIDLPDFPTTGITQGPGTISKASLKIMLVNDSPSKTEALIKSHSGNPTGECPASFLNEFENVIWIVSDNHKPAFEQQCTLNQPSVEPEAGAILNYFNLWS